MIIKVYRKKRQGVTLVIVVISLFILLAAAGLVIDTGIVLNAQSELQKQTETAALIGATLFEPKRDGNTYKLDTADISTAVQDVFNLAKNSNFNSELDPMNIEINPMSRAVRVKSVGRARTYFLSLLNIYTIKLNSQATAISMPFYLSSSFPKTPYVGSLMATSTLELDVRNPVGFNNNAGKNTGGIILDNYLYGPPDNRAVPLGAGGYITMRLPTPVVDEEGADLFVKELGNMEGYYVFIGNDINPDNPYIDESSQGDGIEWTNISCTGIPEGDNLATTQLGAYYTDVDHLSSSSTNEAKFYGSGYFDLGESCYRNGVATYSANIKSGKYLKIIDDNSEDGFMSDNPTVPVALYGEHTTVTPGADIDAVGVLHHSQLIMSADYDSDTDADGLINMLEAAIGTDTSSADSDSDGISDALEYSGWYDVASPKSIVNSSSNHLYYTSPVVNDGGSRNILVFD